MVKQNLNRINNQLLKGKKNFFQEKSNPTQIPGKDPHHNYFFDNDIHPIKAVTLHNNVIYRMQMIPRSYDERVYTDCHDVGFKLSSNSIGYFG